MERIEAKTDGSKALIADGNSHHGKWQVFKRYRAWLATFAVIACGAWTVYHFYLVPKEDAALVFSAMQHFEQTPHGKRAVEELTKRSPSDRVALTFLALSPKPEDVGNTDQVTGYLAALRIGMRAGIPEAKLRYGVALRDGLIGKRDSVSALKIFDEVSSEMESGVKAGDPVALYVSALMLKEGLGTQPDEQRALERAKRAVMNLDGWRLESAGYGLANGLQDDGFLAFFDSALVFSLGIFEGHPDQLLASKVASRLIDQKMVSGPSIGSFSCVDLDMLKRMECMKSWYERGVNAGIERYALDYALMMLKTGEPLEKIVKFFKRSEKYSNPYNRYLFAVISSMLATDDEQLMRALTDMWQQVSLHTDLPDEYSLKVGLFGLDEFQEVVAKSGWEEINQGKTVSRSRIDNFLIAANVRGILMNREEWMQQQLLALFTKSGYRKLPKPTDIKKISSIAAQAIRDGVPVEKVVLGKLNSGDDGSYSNYFDKFDTPLKKSIENSKPVDLSSKEPVVDPEQQGNTGYLKGAPRAAVGGLSTFTVDNRQGGRDAVARIYLNGKKPAVRSMYVKQGETFKAEGILPGIYVFRYRFIGSEDTFESDKDFPLTQAETASGTRFSNITVTLFKVKDGNMSSRIVAPDDF